MLFSSFECEGTRSALVMQRVRRRRELKKENSGRRR
jgi:hypothetical protein